MAEEFEKNRKDLLSTIEQLKNQSKIEEEKGRIVVFGEKTPFIESLIQIVERKYRVRFFSNADEASAYCLKYEAKVIILDMDPPTDWKMSTDVFSAVKTNRPDTTFIICTKAPSAVPVQTLAAQKADVLAIPFSSDILFRKIKGGL